MFKIFLRTLFILILSVIILVLYLSFFGIKTDKFNEIIKSQIANQDNKFDIILEDVFIKLNIKERSLSLNSKNVDFLILKESQKIANIKIFIGLDSFVKKENKIKKIIINSKENEIKDLLKFIRAYKISIPTLYLQNSVSKGKIIYDLTINNNNEKLDQIEIVGKIINAKLNILDKAEFEKINLNFKYNNQKLEIYDLNLKHKNLNFFSNRISANINKKLIKIKGDLQNKINLNLISSLIDYDLKDFFHEKNILDAKSNFELSFSKKFKIKDYKFQSILNYEDLEIKLDNVDLIDYIKDFNKKIILKNGQINIDLSNNKKTDFKITSKFVLDEKNTPRNILFNYSKFKLNEDYHIEIDLTESDVILDDLNFNKKRGENLFLDLKVNKSNDKFKINNLKLFNSKNKFTIKNMKFINGIKIENFNSIEANYLNSNNFKNDISIIKKNDLIQLNSNNFDISSNVEKSLKSTKKNNILNLFQNLNSVIKLDIKSAKIDNDHNLNNFKGEITIKKNKVDKATLDAQFDSNNNFVYTKNEIDGKKITTIFSDIAKPFIKKFKFIKGFEDGKLDYTSTEINNNLSESELRIYDFKLQDMPALTKLLSLASLQGIADLATGEGIRFNEFDMFFDHTDNLITIKEIYALGPAISILMEGYVEKNKLVSLRGTLVPATTINKTIAKIPLLGNILVGEKAGEGVFGVSFKIKGPPDKLDTKVNPIKTLTPRFITRTLDKIKKSN